MALPRLIVVKRNEKTRFLAFREAEGTGFQGGELARISRAPVKIGRWKN